MNVGFYVPRNTFIRIYGPLIDFFLKEQWGVYIFCDHRISQRELTYKQDQFPKVTDIPKFKINPEIIAFNRLEDLVQTILKNEIRVFFVITFGSFMAEVKKILFQSNYSLIIAELQSFLDTIALSDWKSLSNVDIVYAYSNNWIKWWEECLVHFKLVNEKTKAAIFSELEKKFIPIGVPEIDQIREYDKVFIRRKYRLPKGKKIVLLLPFPWYGHGFSLDSQWNLWTHMVYKPQKMLVRILKLLNHKSSWKYLPKVLPDMWKGLNDRKVINAIRIFCNRNNAILIVKARKKNPVIGYLKQIADHIIFDEGFYPYTTLELLFIADLSIGYLTTAVLESVLAGTPSLSLVPEYGKTWPTDDNFFFTGDFSSEPGNFFNFDGVVYSESIADIVLNMPDKTFEDYKLYPANRDKFIKKYLGYSDYRACERIYNDLCQRLGVEA